MALNVISKMSARIRDVGPENYLKQIEAYREIDPHRDEANLMQRPFSSEDIMLISEALESAENTLLVKSH